MIESVTPLSPEWWPDPEAYARAVRRHPQLDVESETHRFVSRYVASRERRKSWLHTWRSAVAQRAAEVQAERVLELTGTLERASTPPSSSTLPAAWRPDPMSYATAAALCPEIDVEAETTAFVEKCRSHHIAHPIDAWRIWIRSKHTLRFQPQ